MNELVEKRMKTPWSRWVLWAGLISVVILAGLYLRAEIQLRNFAATLAQLEADCSSAEQKAATLRSTVEQVPKETTLLVVDEKSTPEETRHNATLAVIARIKAAHEATPTLQPKKRIPPPVGPMGLYFPELLSDPEYSAAYLVHLRSGLRTFKKPELLRLGLSDEVSEKIITVLAERQMALEDSKQLAGDRKGVPGKLRTAITEDTNRQLLQLMGSDVYQKYMASEPTVVVVPNADGKGGTGYYVPSHETLVADSRSMLVPRLATRLSFSEAPLQPAQADQLAELLAASSTGLGDRPYKIMFTDAFIEKTSAVLSPNQVEALRQLQAEQKAAEQRAKLPKSSELPRSAPLTK